MELSKLITSIKYNKDITTKFIIWYNNKLKDFNSYVLKTTPEQLGMVLLFFEEEYNIGFHCSLSSYYIYYIDVTKSAQWIEANAKVSGVVSDEIKFNPFNESEMTNSIFETYEIAIKDFIEILTLKI